MSHPSPAPTMVRVDLTSSLYLTDGVEVAVGRHASTRAIHGRHCYGGLKQHRHALAKAKADMA